MPSDTLQHGKSKRVTLAEVAEKAGVSLSSVSLALNSRGRISPEVRERIARIAEELGYRVKRARDHRATGLHGCNVAVLLDRRFFELVDSYFFQILRGLQHEAEVGGFQIVFSTVGPEQVRDGWRAVVPANVNPDAAVVVGITDPAFVESFRDSKVPVVFVSAGVKGVSEFDTVVSDDFQGMEEVFAHLSALGHRRIAFLGGGLDQLSAANRLRAFKIHYDEFFGASDASLVEIAFEGNAQSAGYETCTNLLARHVDFTALICTNDEMARGAVEALLWTGLRVPEDVSVVGFENREISQVIRPPLTTVQINCSEMGKIACELLNLRMRELAEISPLHVLVAPQLIVRSSTAAPAQGEPPWTRSRYGPTSGGGQ